MISSLFIVAWIKWSYIYIRILKQSSKCDKYLNINNFSAPNWFSPLRPNRYKRADFSSVVINLD